MCMEDVAISRCLTRERFNAAATNAGPTMLAHEDHNRYSLVINTDGAAVVWIGDENVAVGNGIPFKVTDPPLLLCVEEHGRWVSLGVWVIAAAAGPVQVGALSSSFEPELMPSAIASLKYNGG